MKESRIIVLTGGSRVYVCVCVRGREYVCVAHRSICVNYAFGIGAEVRNKKRDPNEFWA